MRSKLIFLLLIDVIYGAGLTELTTYLPPSVNITDSEEFFFEDKILRHQFTLPGTKYCGPGNRAKGPDDLGIFVNVDLCCRDHDNCSDNIPAGEYKHGLHNTSPYTKSNCICDETFHVCLKEVHTIPSRIVGAFYFSFFHIECYKKEHPVIECTRRRRRRCLEYKLNITATPVYQWFDSPFFRHWIDQFPNITVLNDTFNEYLDMANTNTTDIPNKLIFEIFENETEVSEEPTTSSIYFPAVKTSKISIFDYLFPKTITTLSPTKLLNTTINLDSNIQDINNNVSIKHQNINIFVENQIEKMFNKTTYSEINEFTTKNVNNDL